MSTLIILVTQTKGVAIIVIISLLLGAAAIGYLTAWLYSKSIYEKKIKAIESEKVELNNQIINLNEEIGNLSKSLLEREDEIANLKKGD
ncbi:hypothetical protein ACFLR8_02690 [Bacteroidota bacterium]